MNDMMSFITGQTSQLELQKKNSFNQNEQVNNIFNSFNVPVFENPFEQKKRLLLEKVEEFKKLHSLVTQRINWINQREFEGTLYTIPNYSQLLEAYEFSVKQTSEIKNDIMNILGREVTIDEIVGGLRGILC